MKLIPVSTLLIILNFTTSSTALSQNSDTTCIQQYQAKILLKSYFENEANKIDLNNCKIVLDRSNQTVKRKNKTILILSGIVTALTIGLWIK